MKRNIFLSIIFMIMLFPMVNAQTKAVSQDEITQTERIIDKYLDKAGVVIDSTIARVTPLAKEAFKSYSDGYKARGTILFWATLILLCVFSVLSFGFGIVRYFAPNDMLEEDASILAMICGAIAFVALLVFVLSAGDAYTMMKAPDYWVIKDLLGK